MRIPSVYARLPCTIGYYNLNSDKVVEDARNVAKDDEYSCSNDS